MLLSCLGVLALLAVNEAAPSPPPVAIQEVFTGLNAPSPSNADVPEECSKTVSRLPASEWEILREAGQIYNSNRTMEEKIVEFRQLMGQHHLLNSTSASMELLAMMILTDWERDPQQRAKELLHVMQAELSKEMFTEDEDYLKIIEVAFQLPLMVADKGLKELARLRGDESRKRAQKSLRSMTLSETYWKQSQEGKKHLFTKIVLCYVATISPDSQLFFEIAKAKLY